ncbi:MAG: (2Fe-2S)-binding protein [Gammaproteobacteria bacterium]|nr:MAG: (2Fe-2S)-binding protein [Gammaproteobacteria bacterium]
MYICICNAITDKQILKAQAKGCESIDDIMQELGVGDSCGKCIVKAENLLIENAGVQRFSPSEYSSELKANY